jgi:hypothetical protein
MTTTNACGNGLSGTSGTGSYAGTTSPSFTTPSLGSASATGLTLNSGTTIATYSNGTFVPSWTSLTVVGTPTYTGTYVRIGAAVHCWLQVLSTTSTASTLGTTTFTGLPYAPSANSVITAVNAGGFTLGTGIVSTSSSGTCFTPTWTAASNIIIYFTYQVSTN